MNGSVLICGTHSDAGKSVVAAGICRFLANEGVKVAPFKAQNMALNSFVTLDGAEIGRAQTAQAQAARAEPEAAMNPVLLKASAGNRTQVVVMGKPHSDATAMSYQEKKRALMPVVLEAFESLKSRYEVVVCEGAGSPAEINLRKNDLANLGLARAANVPHGIPTILVGDIDRGGLFASLYGTLALLSEGDRAMIKAFVVNKFRGDVRVLEPGLATLTRLTGRPFLGTLPFVPGLELDGEDSMSLDRPPETKPPLGRNILKVAIARFPRISNFTDYDALAHEPGVEVRFTRSAAELENADLAVLPGTKATVEDLAWMRSIGMDEAVRKRARRALPTLGVCGGYQMLGRTITDEIESMSGEVQGLGLLPVETRFEREKVLERPSGAAVAFGSAEVSGYGIHHGRVRRSGGEPLMVAGDSDEGCVAGSVYGTSWHGIFESDGFRRAFLEMVAGSRGLDWRPGDGSFASAREERFDRLAGLVSENLDRDLLLRIIDGSDGIRHTPLPLPVMPEFAPEEQPETNAGRESVATPKPDRENEGGVGDLSGAIPTTEAQGEINPESEAASDVVDETTADAARIRGVSSTPDPAVAGAPSSAPEDGRAESEGVGITDRKARDLNEAEREPKAPSYSGDILFLTTADTEILAASRATESLPEGFPNVRCRNPVAMNEAAEELPNLLDGAVVVLVRLLGGRKAWPEGLKKLFEGCEARDIPLLAFGGESEPDAELTALSTPPAGVVATAFEYLRHGGVSNTENLLRFVADTLLLEGFGFDEPEPLPDFGVYHPRRDGTNSAELLASHDPSKPTVGVVFYRAHWMAGNTDFIDSLVREIESAGANALPVFAYSLRAEPDGTVPALELLEGRADALVTTVLASGGSNASDASSHDGPEGWLEWEVPAFAALDIPIIQGICTTSTREAWLDSDAGLSPLDTAWQVAIPEFDGRVISVPFSFKETVSDDSPVGAPLTVYRADPERTARVAGMAARFARLGKVPNEEKRVAVMLSNYPTKHSRVGNAVGLDTPRSAILLLDALRKAGYLVEDAPDDGDELIHSLIASGGHDLEFLTEDQLRGATGRVPAERYESWFSKLPEELRSDVIRQWGEPPGDLYLDGDELVVAGLVFGNVFVGIQPPRGFGENPIAIYHDPELAPTHHYLAAYWWVMEEFGADAVVHLGKHGTLEWLPGKSLGLSASCAPDAAIKDVPFFYPFVVNDPGEGTQAKRRAHATVVDHLIPPMTRAETYDDLARLEQLLDEYYQVETLDPSKLPAIEKQVWECMRSANLDRDLGVDEKPEEFGDFIGEVDGYLCEIKDLPIRGGLHVLGEAPTGEAFRHLTAAILRLGAGDIPGLRRAVAAAFGLDEKHLTDDGGVRMESPQRLAERFGDGNTAATASDVLELLESAQQELLIRLEEAGWSSESAEDVCRATLGFVDPGVVASLRFACEEVVPRLQKTPDEVGNLVGGLDGKYVPAGPSGSPTRGLVNVLPTGRNFYSVDPKALPSGLSWEVGERLAGDLLSRHLQEEGRYPETVGIVVWGTAAMRTQGDDIAEVLALVGVCPVWNEESLRVTGLEVIPLEELGRPRIDVNVRISGFFRDAFPNLISLMDEAIRTVAALDESHEMNFVKKHADEEKSEGATERESTTRIFGSKPGAYGAGLLPLIDARNWRDDHDLAEVYAVWGGYAYGKGLDGREARKEMEANLRRTEVAVKNIDNREHDLFDSDDYFQYHGGMIAAVRALTGRNPKSYIGDSADPLNVKTRDLAEESRRVFRSRVANPKWIDAMKNHGYKGAFELSATVDYLFGYDATANVVEDWMYRDIAEKYALDESVREFMSESNPWALRAITERLIEAAERGMWQNPENLDALKAVYLENEGVLEEAT